MRDARTQLTGTLRCVKSKVLTTRDYTKTHNLVVMSHDGLGYLISKELFTNIEIEKAKRNYCYFQIVNSGGIRSVCDIIGI